MLPCLRTGFSPRQAFLAIGRRDSIRAACRNLRHTTAPTSATSTETVASAARTRANAAGAAFREAIQTHEELRRIVNETLVNRSRRLMLGTSGAMFGLGTFIYAYRKETRQAVATELSDVASRSLGDQKMQAQAQHVTIQTL